MCQANQSCIDRDVSTVLLLLGTRLGFIDHYSHCYTRRIKEAIHIRLHSNNINGDDEIEIPDWMAWMRTIKKHKSRSVAKPTYEGITSNSQNNNEY